MVSVDDVQRQPEYKRVEVCAVKADNGWRTALKVYDPERSWVILHSYDGKSDPVILGKGASVKRLGVYVIPIPEESLTNERPPVKEGFSRDEVGLGHKLCAARRELSLEGIEGIKRAVDKRLVAQAP